ncbi:hypothetical protein EV06_0831 [Prochlorococcus sp. MIT 0602]|nr:hypothetical protein EV06_0831 [Prochlorococcus sp. MIT 0602]KGG17240.1 hypothetical protein EV07_0677 [Prochlorococcus sp. MIT 0603]
MGEAKRRKEQGLAPKAAKKRSKPDSISLLVKYPALPYLIIGIILIYLVYDLIKYYK